MGHIRGETPARSRRPNGRPPGRPVWLLDLAAAAAWTAAITGALLAGGGIWEHVNSGDLHAMLVPWYEHAARAVVREGRLPLWDPNQFCGTPVLGLGQSAVLYPPVLLAFAVLPPRAALQFLYAEHVFLLTLGFTLYGRRHGIGRTAAGLAALVAVVGILRGPLLAGVDHPAFLGCVAWVPWLLLCWERALTDPPARWIACFAVCAALQWVAGYPDFAIDLPVLLGVMALVRPEATLGRRLGTLALGLGLGAALAAVQLWPIAETVGESPRLDTRFHTLLRSIFAVKAVSQLGTTLLYRLGPGALALAAAGLWPPTRLRLAWLAALLWALFALNWPLRSLYLVPPFSGLRFPFGWSGYASVLVGLFAGAGLATLLRARARAARVAGAALALTAVGFGLTAVARAPRSVPPFDPGSASYRAPDLELVAARVAELRRLQTAAAPATNGAPRVLSEREAAAAAGIRHALPLPNGHDPSVPPRRIVDLLERAALYDGLGLYRHRDWAGLAAEAEVATLLGIGLVVVPTSKVDPLRAAGFAPVGTLPAGDTVLARRALPRARLVHRLEETTGAEDTLALLFSPGRDAEAVAVVEAGRRPPVAEAPAGASEHISIVEDLPERLTLDVGAAAPALLVLTDTFYPGWQATVDGEPVAIVRADHAFRGVPVNTGRHRVVFLYAPASLRRGAAVSLVAALGVILCLAWPGARRGRSVTRTET
jgi:hypothetical protein